MKWRIILILLSFLPYGFSQTQDIFTLNQNLGRGINFGNALEAPSEGSWGMTLEPEFFSLVNHAGFDSIRLPISWTHHTSQTEPYTINANFMARVQWAVEQASMNDLNIIVNVHHYDELNANPRSEKARFQAIWQQIARAFKDEPQNVYFELLNEPHEAFNDDAELWNEMLADVLSIVRESNPTRAVIVGPVSWNNTNKLDTLELPDDPNLIATVHFYDPFGFTHQGAEWVTNSPPLGATWTGGNKRLSYRWQNKSTDAELSFETENNTEYLHIEFKTSNAKLELHSIISPRNYTDLALTTKEDESLIISCHLESEKELSIQTKAGIESLVKLQDCGAEKVLRDIIIKNATGEAKIVQIEQLEFRAEGKPPISPVEDDASDLRETLNNAQEWAQKNNRPLFLGEFGAYSKADMASRVLWTRFMREEAEKRNMSWAYWEFGAGFGIYDRATNSWRQDLLEALIPN